MQHWPEEMSLVGGLTDSNRGEGSRALIGWSRLRAHGSSRRQQL
jgi:hypothetical protein